jgi:acyl-CoA synthetase (AMP-forming)/AMP-acid ligase II
MALNVRLAPAELQELLARSRPRALFVSDRYTGTATELRGQLAAPATVVVFGPDGDFDTFVGKADEGEPGVDVDPEGTLSLAFTSGTTGQAKGVLQSLRMMTNVVAGGIVDFDIRAGDIRYSAAALFHIAGAAFPLMCLSLGATSHVLPQFEGPVMLARLQADVFTGVFLVPTMISTLLQLPNAGDADYERLRSVVYGSASMTPAMLRRAMETFGCDFIQGFGATETGTQFVLSADDHHRALAGEEHLLASSGRPGLGVEARILGDDGRELPRGEVGEIATRSNQQMTEYLDMPAETAAARPDGWFRGGDLGSFDEQGYLFLAGRKNDLIVRGGENIYAIEIESVLAEQASVVEVAVVGKPDDHWGEVVHAYVVLRPGEGPSEDDLKDHCRAHLATFKVPTAVHLVEELPKTAGGKVLKRVLRELP